MEKPLLLFDVPATGQKKSYRKPAKIKINRVNREVAKDRYYYHRCLNAEFEVNAATRQIKTDYISFEAIPKGQRYYVGKLVGMGYEIQFKLFTKSMHTSHQAKLLKAGFTIYQGATVGDRHLVIKAKTPDNHNWHIIEKDFESRAALKRRLHELDKMPKFIDLHDTKNTF